MTAADCFAVERRLLPLAEAFALIAERVQPVTGFETIPLQQALGRVLADPLAATLTQPPFANSAMDGYAVRFADLAKTRYLPVAARIAAGHPEENIPPGAAVQIFTGAPLPPGFDTVVMQEDCRAEHGHVVLPEKLTQGSHVRLAGIDFKPGDLLVPSGRRLRPQDIGILAATGISKVTVRKRLKVGLFSTGDELAEVGAELKPGQIHDSNRPMLNAALSAMGFEVQDLGNLEDRVDSLVTAFGLAGLEHHALISTGGVSVGGEDHVKAAIEQLGQLHFWKLALKPGKPLALGQIGDTAFIGLPGNPVSSLISLLLVGRSVLHRLAGASLDAVPPPPIQAPTTARLARAEGRINFLRARLGDKGVTPFFSQDSSLISSLVASTGLIEVEIGTGAVEPGEMVKYHAYDSLMR
jgi:molybdopterin molybdotransferase